MSVYRLTQIVNTSEAGLVKKGYLEVVNGEFKVTKKGLELIDKVNQLIAN
ncbi:hypothetical protein [Beggiatoa leptomitoformis]|uniref:ArnR1-like winged helix-turn-helix domain-containing protein n=1 Tax=Beggiatoa leptomitoformis TaxID=288004 RepID=A0A650GCZ9_9GAMM|nr:hypothetical protein [Beggiatoa leptomitoformis]QGX03422.1 hypothetical protein AL038_18166 [Beggiatoa leptomitoformis]QGX04013.1 hypothetical protein BLE401_18355 [Beggiatoa leptomitoformis]